MRIEIMYKILFGVMLILFLVVGVYIGVEISSKEAHENVIASANDKVTINVEPYVEQVMDEEKTIDVSVEYTDVYPECGHTIESEEEYEDSKMSNVKEEIENRDLGYRLIGSEDGLLIYQKVHTGKCLNHYKVILENDTVKIYRINQTGEFEMYQDTEIGIDTIREGIKEELIKGIMIDELEELLLLIEDIES